MQRPDNKPLSLVKKSSKIVLRSILSVVIIVSLLTILLVSYLVVLDRQYEGKIYPRVFVGTTPVGGLKPEHIYGEWEKKNEPYKATRFELQLDHTIATVSGEELRLGFDSTLIARQAYLIGRSGNLFSDLYTKLFRNRITITPYFRWDKEVLNTALGIIAQDVDIPPQDALFDFANGKVTTFRPAQPGKRLNQNVVYHQIEQLLPEVPFQKTMSHPIILSLETIEPSVPTEKANTYGIKERIGYGYSEFSGSIPGRIHNVALAANRFHGILIAPEEEISYNKIIGDISSATGFQPAYIIMNGRTVLGDGGGVCQVSTTLFRAALNAGLPIIERQPHAYRVHYYEDGGFKPGLDATVFAPSVDLKIKNDTPGYILIQSKVDTKKLTLAIEFYGTSDGRTAQILDHKVLSETPPPPALYQDDPTLPQGTVKQVDWSAWGAKTVFTYRVQRGNDTLIDRQFVSNYRPWQAVYLKGVQ